MKYIRREVFEVPSFEESCAIKLHLAGRWKLCQALQSWSGTWIPPHRGGSVLKCHVPEVSQAACIGWSDRGVQDQGHTTPTVVDQRSQCTEAIARVVRSQCFALLLWVVAVQVGRLTVDSLTSQSRRSRAAAKRHPLLFFPVHLSESRNAYDTGVTNQLSNQLFFAFSIG